MQRSLLYTLRLLVVITTLIIVYSIYSIENIDIWMFLFWVVLAAISESLPVFITKDRAVSVTLAILIAAQLSHGTYFTVLVGASCFILVIAKYPDNKYKNFFTIPWNVSAINISNLAISLLLSGWLSDYLNQFSSHNMSIMPYSLLAITTYIVSLFVLNSLIMTLYVYLANNVRFISTWVHGVFWALPNLLAITPMGFFIHKFYELPTGYFYVLLLFGPLLLARYSFKLYLDSQSQYYKTIKTLTAAIEAKDEYTEGHSRRVEYYAEMIATRMKLSAKKIESIKVAALLHDIGKIGIDDSILRKPEKLNDDEWVKIRQHPSIGAKILEDVPFPDKIKVYIEHHHEKYNGTGYPDKLKAGQIPIEACILTAADAYDAMTSDRPYRDAMSRKTAMENLRKDRGTHFHPVVADVLLQILEEEVLKEQEAAARAEQEAAYQEAALTVEP